LDHGAPGGSEEQSLAIGARIKVTVQDDGQAPRSIYRTVTSGGSFGASPLQQHIGLGKSARITELEVRWPTSRTRQKFTDVKKDQFIEIKEFAKDVVVLEKHSFRLGGAQREAGGRPSVAPPDTSK
jgi:hypothetical protein